MITTVPTPATPESLNSVLSEVELLLQRGQHLSAWDLACTGLEEYPDSIKLQHRAVLALARSGATEQANSWYKQFDLGNHTEEDFQTLGARIAKDFALLSKADNKAEMFDAAANAYKRIYESTSGYYPAVNAATLKVLAGKFDEGEALAEQALVACNACENPSDESYYLAVTRAEALLVLNRTDDARAALQDANTLASGDFGALASTLKQLRLLCNAYSIDASVLDAIKVPDVIHYSGHMIGSRYPAKAEREVTDLISEHFNKVDISSAYGSLACGADIQFAEAALKRGVELHIILPFEIEEFRSVSVSNGGSGWSKRFDACLEAAESVTIASYGGYLGDNSLFLYCSKVAMGLAVLHANQLCTDVHQVALWDGVETSGVAGTGADIAIWRMLGRKSYVLPFQGFENVVSVDQVEPNGDSSEMPVDVVPPRLLRAILFGDVKGFSKLSEDKIPTFIEAIMGTIGRSLDRYGEDVCFRNTWGDAIHAVFTTADVAAECAVSMQKDLAALDYAGLGLPGTLGLRVGVHYGPIFEGRDLVLKSKTFFGTNLSRTARIEPVTPVGQVYGTEQFAAILALYGNDEVVLEYVGNIPAAKGYGDFRMFMIRT